MQWLIDPENNPHCAAGEKVLPPHMTDSLFLRLSKEAVNGSGHVDLKYAVRMTKKERQ